MPAYLLLGPEHGKKKEFIDKTASAYIKKQGLPAQTYRFYADREESENFLRTLLNPSLFGDLQIFIVSGAEKLKGKPAEETGRYLRDPSPSNLLFLCSDETSPGAISKNLSGSFDKEHTVIFWELFESDKRSWVISFFLSRQMKISPEAVSELLDTVTNDTEELRSVCSRLADYKGNGSEVTAADWENFFYHSKEENVFTLFERITEEKFELSVEIAGKILDSGEAGLISLAAGLAWQFRRLLRIHLFLNGSSDISYACEQENIRGKRNQRMYAQAVKTFTREQTQGCLQLLNQTDLLLKSGVRFADKVIADLLIYRILIQKGSVTDLFPSCAVPD